METTSKTTTNFSGFAGFDLRYLETGFNSGYLVPQLDWSTLSNEELLEQLRKADDFQSLVFPSEWYSKYSLPEKKALSVKDFLKESPWMKTSKHYYVGKKEIPAQPGGIKPTLPSPEVTQTVMIENSFSDKDEGKDFTMTQTPITLNEQWGLNKDGEYICKPLPFDLSDPNYMKSLKDQTVSEHPQETRQS